MDDLDRSEQAISKLLSARKDFVRFVRSKVESDAAAEDIVQNAFVRSIESSEPANEEKIVSWFYTILRNAVIDHYRRRASATNALNRLEREILTAGPPEEEDQREICKCLSSIVETLKPEYQEVINKIDLQDLEVKEFAGGKGITVEAARVRVHRARKALLVKLKETCGMCAEHGCLDCSCERNGEEVCRP